MTSINPTIIKFIKEHHILTLATSNNNTPYCATCFYSFNADEIEFVITSEFKTRHIDEVLINNKVAGIIALETKIIGKIRGIQFTGKIVEVNDEEFTKYKLQFLKTFPFAIFKKTDLWIIKIEYIKMTDNRLGFGEKIHWYRYI